MDFGCSGFSWETTDGLHLFGRTYDFIGNLHNNRIISVPRGYKLPLMPDHISSEAMSGKYAFLGMAAMDLGVPIMVDGINEKGLMGGLLNFYGYACYPSFTDRLTVYPGVLVTLMLALCSNVSEVAEAVRKICLKDFLIQGEELQVHYIFSDLSGESIVLEPGPNGIEVYRQTIGVLTNVPDFHWQMTNLRNYVAVTDQPADSQTIISQKIHGFSLSSGSSFGLPGGYSSPERFVRLTFTKNFAHKGTGEIDGVTRMFHCLAPVIIPRGLLKIKAGQSICMETLNISVMCAESLTYYFAPGENHRISAIRLKPEIDNRTIKYYSIPDTQDIFYMN